MLRFQENEIDKLIKEVELKKQTIDSLLKNPKFLSYYKLAKNKEIKYTDSNNINKVMKIESTQQLFNLMVDIFRLEN